MSSESNTDAQPNDQESPISPETEQTSDQRSPISPETEQTSDQRSPISPETEQTSDQRSPIPPETELTAPSSTNLGAWFVVAKNRRINRDWEDLLRRHPENTAKCYEFLCSNPMERIPGKVFPLKGRKYTGAWEYEVPSGDRVFYVPDSKTKKVLVYYAGKHPKRRAPTPP